MVRFLTGRVIIPMSAFRTSPTSTAIASVLLALTLSCSTALATDYSWNSGVVENWNTSANWLPLVPAGPPGAGDNVITPTLFGQTNVNVAAVAVTNWTYNSTSSQEIVGFFGSGSTMTISGTLDKSGSGSLTIRNSGSGAVSLSVGNLTHSAGTLLMGTRASPNRLASFALGGSASISNAAVLQLNVASPATIAGALTLSNTSKVHIATGASATSGTLSVGSLVSASTTTILAANDYSTTVTSGTLIINGASGTATYAGRILSTSNASTSSVVSVQKDGGSTQIFTGTSNTYTGTTTVNAGTLLINGTHSGGGAYSVNNGGTLGGTGTIGLAANASASILSGGKLNASSLDNLALTLSGTGVLNVSGALGGATSMFFTLGAPASTVISLTGGGLNIGTGVLNFDDFLFTAGGGFTAGVYTLFGGANALTGTLGSSLTGNIAGQSSTIGLSGNNVILTVDAIPEPSTWALLAAGLTVVVTFRRRRS